MPSTSPSTLSLLETKGIQLNVLVEEMNEIFPPVNPTPHMTDREIMFSAGQRSVVEWILNKMDESRVPI